MKIDGLNEEKCYEKATVTQGQKQEICFIE
jgi:hypothetical protein